MVAGPIPGGKERKKERKLERAHGADDVYLRLLFIAKENGGYISSDEIQRDHKKTKFLRKLGRDL